MTEDAELSAARDAVRAAGVVCRAVGARLDEIAALTKNDRSPVTVADFASQAVVIHHLRQALGDVTVVGEENAEMLRSDDGAATRKLVLEATAQVWPDVTEDALLEAIDFGSAREVGPTYWTLDPIDGTKGFLRGGQYAVSLCRVESGIPELGVLGCPNLARDQSWSASEPVPPGTLYWARRGDGVFEEDVGSGERASLPTTVSAPEDRVRVAESVESGHTRHDDSAAIVKHLGLPGDFVRLDGQGKYAVVARGQADAYMRLPTRPGYEEKVWDHAAGVLIAQEGGATVTDIRGKPLDFSIPPTLRHNRGVICARGSLHARLLEAIEALALFPE